MTILNKISILSILIVIIGCKSDYDKTTEYITKSNELISQILSEEENKCSCIFEPNNQLTTIQILSSEDPRKDYKKIFKQYLNIKTDSLIHVSNVLTKSYKIDATFRKKYRIITQTELDSIYKSHKNGNDRLNALSKMCPNLWVSYSPPIFNEKLDKAIIPISFFPGGGLILYKYENGKWKHAKRITFWIS